MLLILCRFFGKISSESQNYGGVIFLKKVLAIIGPTAVGKTALSIEIAKQYQGEVISGDSMQVYRGLDIGTAKIMPVERQGVPHYLIDIREIDERYSVADFVAESRQLIDQITARGGLPIIVGGTGFYLKALLYDMNLGGDQYEATESVRKKWHTYAATNGQQALWDHLNQIDPDAAEKIPVSNERRIVRALEVYEQTGQLFSKQQTTLTPRYDALVIGLNTDRARLYQRIEQRVDQMIDEGLETEARQLYDAGGQSLAAGKGIGYRELFPYFDGQITREMAIDKIKQDTRHYAKRQLTWFRHQIPVEWFDLLADPTAKDQIEDAMTDWLSKWCYKTLHEVLTLTKIVVLLNHAKGGECDDRKRIATIKVRSTNWDGHATYWIICPSDSLLWGTRISDSETNWW